MTGATVVAGTTGSSARVLLQLPACAPVLPSAGQTRQRSSSSAGFPPLHEPFLTAQLGFPLLLLIFTR